MRRPGRAGRLRDDRRAAPAQPGRGTSRSSRSRPTTTPTSTPTPRSSEMETLGDATASAIEATGRRAVLAGVQLAVALPLGPRARPARGHGRRAAVRPPPVRGRHGAAAGGARGPDRAVAGGRSPSTSRRPQAETKAGSLTWLLAAMGWPEVVGRRPRLRHRDRDRERGGRMGAVAAALVPGMPHLLAADPAPSWRELAAAARTVGDALRADAASRPLLLLSTQWFTVLGHQVQCDPHLSRHPHRRELVRLRLRPPSLRPRRRRRSSRTPGPTRSTPPGCRPAAPATTGFPSTPAPSPRRR